MKVLLTALICFSLKGILQAQDFEKDADALFQKLEQRAKKNGFRKFLVFKQGIPAFTAESNTEYRIAFMFDTRKADSLKAVLHASAGGVEKVVMPFQVTYGPREGVAAFSIFYYTTNEFKQGPVAVRLDVDPMGIVYVFKKKRGQVY